MTLLFDNSDHPQDVIKVIRLFGPTPFGDFRLIYMKREYWGYRFRKGNIQVESVSGAGWQTVTDFRALKITSNL